MSSTPNLARRVGAEMVGTFALVFAGCGAIVIDELTGGAITHLGIGATFGLVIMVMVFATGHISGAHFNPAVTLAFASLGRFSWREAPSYIAGQVAAATAAAALLALLFGPAADLGATAPAGSAAQSLALEVVITFFLMFVIAAVATDARAAGQLAGVAIGGAVALAAVFAGPISGASMNPARSLGPALAAPALSHAWVYIIGPIAGAALGAWIYRLVCCAPEERRAGGCC